MEEIIMTRAEFKFISPRNRTHIDAPVLVAQINGKFYRVRIVN